MKKRAAIILAVTLLPAGVVLHRLCDGWTIIETAAKLHSEWGSTSCGHVTMRKNAVRRRIRYHGTGWIEYDEFYPKKSKPFVDEIDRILCSSYGLSPEELDYLMNFDVKFRLGQEEVEDEEQITTTDKKQLSL